MPVVFRHDGIRFYFFSNEGTRANRSISMRVVVTRTRNCG